MLYKISLILIFLLLTGCDTLQKKTSGDFFEKSYYKIRNSDCYRLPEFYGLKEKIKKLEYRVLPHYLQDCYEEKEEPIIGE